MLGLLLQYWNLYEASMAYGLRQLRWIHPLFPSKFNITGPKLSHINPSVLCDSRGVNIINMKLPLGCSK
jgi:hypothetical protein